MVTNGKTRFIVALRKVKGSFRNDPEECAKNAMMERLHGI